jgi:predicted amidohydrolase YtcJ
MYTINGAYASFEEGIKGSITPGKLADIVLLSDDPTKVPPEQIKDIKVEMTMIGRKVVWEG